MKALSLTQPWASLMAIGVKKNETRGRRLTVNGDIVICATKEIWKSQVPSYAIPALQILWNHKDKFTGYFATVHDLYFALPFGKAVCVVEKYDCVQTRNFIRNADRAMLPLRTITHEEWTCGDYSPGRFAYLTRNLRRLNPEISVTGKQGLFDLPPDVEKMVRAQLTHAQICYDHEIKQMRDQMERKSGGIFRPTNSEDLGQH